MLQQSRGLVRPLVSKRFLSLTPGLLNNAEKAAPKSLRESFERETIDSYNPKVLSSKQISQESDMRPIPINVEMNYFRPLKHDITHGDLKCEITMRSFDNRSMEFWCNFALRAAYYLGIPVTGPKPLKTRRERWTVNKAPFVHAKSKENFERHTHARLLRLWDANPEVIEIFLQFITKHSVAGVGLKANMYIHEGLNYGEKLGELNIKSLEFPETVSGVGNLAYTSNVDVAERVEELLNEPQFKRYFAQEEASKEETN